MLKKGKKINFDNLSENIDDDINSTDLEVERCDVVFVKYLDDARKIKVKVLDLYLKSSVFNIITCTART